jgi:SH3-like domain-containing protein
MAERAQMRFMPDRAPTTAELRVVRYAVVPLLDRPDEVLGLQLMDLIAGDEVQVIETSSAFWEVVCPDGERGWVHRTTLGLPSIIGRESVAERSAPSEADEVLTALLAARGLN